MKVTARTLAEVRRLAGQLAAAADEPGALTTAAPGPGWVLGEDQPRQEPGIEAGVAMPQRLRGVPGERILSTPCSRGPVIRS